MTVKEYLVKAPIRATIRPRAVCKDGLKLSIQASEFHYCSPKRNLTDGEYKAVEVLVDLSDKKELDRFEKHSFMEESFDGSMLYSNVDMKFLEVFIKEHGGIEGPESGMFI